MRPLVGTAACIFNKDGKVLLGLRNSGHSKGTWQFPGGHVEYGEHPNDTIRREIEEETGIKATNLRFWNFTNDLYPEDGKHYVTLVYVGEHDSGEPKVLEPDKCLEWRWVAREELPAMNLMSPVKQFFSSV